MAAPLDLDALAGRSVVLAVVADLVVTELVALAVVALAGEPWWRCWSCVFTHEEAETIISDARIPPDRQMAYAIELLAGVRPGEGSALRWRHYDPTVRPLGKLLVAKSYSTRVGEKTTKTDACDRPHAASRTQTARGRIVLSRATRGKSYERTPPALR